MDLDDVLNDRQPQSPQSPLLLMRAEERLADLFHQLRRDPAARILDGEGHLPPLAIGLGGHLYPSPCRHRFHGVLKQVEQGDLSVRLQTIGVREARELRSAINSMLERIQELIKVEYQSRLDLREAEYKALLSQVQPHFLYNVLYCLLGLNQLGKRAELEAAVYDLHDMMRYTLDPDPWTTVGVEAAFLSHYCTLQQLRFEERLSFEIKVSPEVAMTRIPRLLLQPLVENAIIHGIEPVSRKCHLEIVASIDGEALPVCLRIVVSDDGQGYDTASPIITGHGLGMQLVGERLKNNYAAARIRIDSALGTGTRIVLEIPV